MRIGMEIRTTGKWKFYILKSGQGQHTKDSGDASL